MFRERQGSARRRQPALGHPGVGGTFGAMEATSSPRWPCLGRRVSPRRQCPHTDTFEAGREIEPMPLGAMREHEALIHRCTGSHSSSSITSKCSLHSPFGGLHSRASLRLAKEAATKQAASPTSLRKPKG